MTYPRTGMQRILAGAANPMLRVTILDQDGIVPATIPSLTCTITRADGTVVATARSTTATDTGATCTLTTAEAATLDVLRADWSESGVVRATTWHRTVGSYLFSIGELNELSGVDAYSPARKLAVRDEITDLFERHTHAVWCHQFDIDETRSYNRPRHAVRFRPLIEVRSVHLDDIEQTITDIDLDPAAGIFEVDFTLTGWMRVGYVHGFDRPTADLRDAALIAAKDRLTRRTSAMSDRARSVTDDAGTRTFSYAGKDHPTGIDEVDAVIMAHAQDDPGIV